jgi:glycosyltransferase involved in cell wall biosynthesis
VPTPELSVVVPVYRNAGTLRELHRRLHAALAGVDCELIFVDDASPDPSRDVLAELAVADEATALVALDENVGQHRAVLAGLARGRGSWSVILDADLQDPPEAIRALLERARAGDVDAVFAGRRGEYESSSRLRTSRLFKRTLHLMCGVPPDAGIFVLLSRRLVDRLVALRGPAPFVVAMVGCVGLPMASIPVERAARVNGDSAYSTWARAKSAWRAFVWVAAWKVGAAR